MIAREKLESSVLFTLLITMPIVGFNAIGTSMQIPMIGDIKDAYGLKDFQTQYMFSVFSLCVGFGQLIFGIVGDTYGRRRVVLLGVLITAVATVMMSFAKSYNMLVLFRAVEGVGTSMAIIGILSMYRDLHNSYALGKIYSLSNAWTALLYISVPMLVEYLLETSDSYQVIYAIWGSVAFGAGAIAYFTLTETNENLDNRRMPNTIDIVRTYMQIAKSENFIIYMLIYSYTIAIFSLYSTTLPITFKALGIDRSELSYYYGLAPLSFAFFSVVISQYIFKLGFRRIIILSVIIHLVSTVVVYMTKDSDDIINSVVIPMMISEAAVACVLSYVPAMALERMKSVAGAASSLLNASSFIIGSIVTFFLTNIFEDNFHNAYIASFLLYAVILSVGGFIIYRIRDEKADGEEHTYDEELEI